MMRSVSAQIVAALLLFTAGVVFWTRGQESDRLADAERALVTLQYDRAAAAGATQAAAAYWTGRYDQAVADTSSDPFLAANAAYRAAMAPGGTASEVATRLDGVVKRYAEVVRNDPSNEDAAYNYEFVVRYRAAIAARGVPIAPAPENAGVTPHGRAGAPPQGSGQKQFKMLVPMRPEERKEAEEAGRTGRRIRKG